MSARIERVSAERQSIDGPSTFKTSETLPSKSLFGTTVGFEVNLHTSLTVDYS